MSATLRVLGLLFLLQSFATISPWQVRTSPQTVQPAPSPNNIVVVDGTTYTSIASAIAAASNLGTTAGTVIVPSGNYLISSTTALGSETGPVTLRLMDGAKITCAITNNTDCIEIPSNSLLIGANWGHGVSTSGSSGIFCGPHASVTSLVTNMSHTGAGDASGGIQNLFVDCSATGANVSQAPVWWRLVSNNWATENPTIRSSAKGPAFLWDMAVGGFLGPLFIENPEINCISAGCVPMEFSGNVGPAVIVGGDINYHPGSAASGDVVVFTPGTLVAGPTGISFYGTHFEFQTTGDVFHFTGVADIGIYDVFLNNLNGTTAANCLHLLNSRGTPGPVRFTGHIVVANNTCTNAVNNPSGSNSNGTTIPETALYQGDIDYTWSGASGNTHTLFMDGQFYCLQPGGCLANSGGPFARTTTINNSSIGTDSPTAVMSTSVTIPPTGGPYRIIASYTLYVTSSEAVNGLNTWVSDGTSIWANAAYYQNAHQKGGLFAGAHSEVSPVTYAAGAGAVTVTLMAQNNKAGPTLTATSSALSGSGAGVSHLQLEVIASQ